MNYILAGSVLLISM